MGHEFIGIVEAVGKEVGTVEKVGRSGRPRRSFWSDGTLRVLPGVASTASCFSTAGDTAGPMSTAVRERRCVYQQADGTFVVLPVEKAMR